MSAGKKKNPPIAADAIPEDKPLTVKQDKFIREYIATGNGAESARLAGYSENTAREMASENLTKPHIKKAIDQRRTETMQDLDEKIAWLTDQLTKEATDAENGDSTRVRALEVLGRVFGAFAPEKQEITQYSGAFLADLEEIEPEPITLEEEKPLENNNLH